jgi:hypothetical protein
MMFGHDFYHGILRRYIIMFGNLFNEIQLNRFNSSGTKVQSINVPISYGPKQKFIQRAIADPTLLKPISTVVPRLGFEFTSLTYAPQRKLNTGHRYVKGSTQPGKSFDSLYTPVPYDINFSLYALVKNAEDGTQIIEQIVPFFTPDWTVTVKIIPEMNMNIDVPIELTSISSEDTYEGDFDTIRVITWQLDFVVKGYLFGPINREKYVDKSTIRLFSDEELIYVQTYQGTSDFLFVETIQSFPASSSPTFGTVTTDSTFITTDTIIITVDIQ